MPKPELGLINQPASTSSHLFDDALSDPEVSSDGEAQETEDLFEKKESEKIEVKGQISGRVPASNGAMGLVQGIDSNLGAGMRIALFRGLKEIGLGFVESIYDDAGGDFDLPGGTALALKYSETNYESGSRYVKEDEVRKACDEAFRRDGRDVIWVETEGVAELGGGVGGTLPIGALADASANFNLSGIIRYRRFEPYESASGTLLKGQALANTANIPISATLARRMPPGGEFEFTGEGNLSFAPALSKPLGYGHELATIGASAKLGGEYALKGETSISVQRLPFGEEVLVKIAHGKSANADIGAALKAGMELKEGAYENVPQVGRGFLKFLLDRMGLPDVPQFVKRFLQSQVKIKSRRERKSTEIARYVFDLSKPKARKAYEDIFTRLSLGQTKMLVSANDPSVRSQTAGETVSVIERGGAAILGQTKLLLLSALQAEREGRVSADGRSDILYRDCKFEKTYVNWFTGEQKVKWEAVTVAATDKSPKHNYLHLTYSNRDRMTEEKEIHHFLGFARGLGIEFRPTSQKGEIGPEEVAKVLADRDDTETKADIYFTQAGIQQIAQTSYADAKKAFLEAEAQLEPNAEGPCLKILERLSEISKKWFFIRIFYFWERSRLQEEYARAAPERSIDGDIRLLQEAECFAKSIGEIVQNDEKSAERFFMALGKANGFNFMKRIAALTKLATVNDTILHELSISGGGLTLAAIDEGEILHPEKAMHRMLTKIA